jgi:hypothetical protein
MTENEIEPTCQALLTAIKAEDGGTAATSAMKLLADEIERLRVENVEMLAALTAIYDALTVAETRRLGIKLPGSYEAEVYRSRKLLAGALVSLNRIAWFLEQISVSMERRVGS